ncbi:PEP-CTERM sorting domain-containing protein [Methylotenera sp. N17]|uniref:PEP-CTERM sorting domain-containing protein n=1 Tax=Methylotenera sp. N17 TaxID=1502761 RepID=UPI000646F25B|nr:PEP-CTERM sorting domain-containing protein [Methylotenera sp. N17]
MPQSSFKLKVLAGLLLAFAGSASATTYTNVPSGANANLPFAYFGNAANPSGDSPMVGQVFALTLDSLLSSFNFYAVGNTSATFQLNVAQWNPSTNAQNQAVNTVGSNLLPSTFTAVDTYNSTGNYTTISFDNLGLNLNANTKYIAFLTSSDSTVTGVQLSRTQTAQDVSGFGLGHAYLSTIPGQGWQLPFNGNGFLSLQYTAVTAVVPEPETYAMLFAGLALVSAAVKRRNAA